MPFRALYTISSGLGTSNANPRNEGIVGGKTVSTRLPRDDRRARLSSSLVRLRSLERLLSRSALWCSHRCAPSDPLIEAASGASLTSSVANAEGGARERTALGENMGTSTTGGSSGSGSGSVLALVREDLLFMASFDCFGSDGFDEAAPPEGTLGEVVLGSGATVGWDGGYFSWFLERRPLRDWYDDVIAVVAVGPFAVGVRYSVVVLGRIKPGWEVDCGLDLLCSCAFA